MVSSLPTPLAAALGLVPAVLEGVRRLPVRAVQLPVLAVSATLTGADALAKEYTELAERGERLFGTLTGQAPARPVDLEQTEPADPAPETPARPAAGFAVAADEAVADIAPLLGRSPAAPLSDTISDVAERAVEVAAAPPTVTTPQARGRVDTAASAQVVETVERTAASVGSSAVDHGELPLPDYDHMTLGSLRGRLRALSVDQLVQIRAYEKAHADRLPVVTMLDNRIVKLASDASATPSGPVSEAPAPEQLAAATGPSGGLSPATTDAPPIPPAQGDPTNPAQPRS